MSTQTDDSSVPPGTAPGTSSPLAGSPSSSIRAAKGTPSQINMAQLLTIVREQVTEVVREAVRDSGAPPPGSMTPSGGRPASGLTGVGPLRRCPLARPLLPAYLDFFRLAHCLVRG